MHPIKSESLTTNGGVELKQGLVTFEPGLMSVETVRVRCLGKVDARCLLRLVGSSGESESVGYKAVRVKAERFSKSGQNGFDLEIAC